VSDLSRQGYTLVGGRLDYLSGEPVAALVYKRRQHVINLFVRPPAATPEAKPPAARQVLTTGQGYHVVNWRADGADYWAVSDLNPAELREFSRLIAIY
jgi:anti-sigma factor RsiW